MDADETYAVCAPPEDEAGPTDHRLRDWLAANGIDWNTVVAWPQIEITEDTLRVEVFQYGPSGQPEIVRGPERGLVRMAEFLLAQAPDPDWWAAYQHTRPQALEQRKIEGIRSWLMHHPPAVMVGRGQTLIFITQDHMPVDDMQAVRLHLKEYLHDIEVVIMSGISQVIAGPKVQVAA